MTDQDDEALQAFLEEAKEHLATLEQELLTLEGRADDEKTVNTIFRAAHTIKGTAGFFALDPIKDLAHGMESVLGLIRDKELACTSEVTSALLVGTDLLGKMIADIPNIARVDSSQALATLRALAQPRVRSAPPPAVPEATAPLALAPSPSPAPAALPAAGGGQAALEGPPEVADVPGAEAAAAPKAAGSIRVNLGQLDRLMRLAGELVLTRNALLKKAGARDLDEMINLAQRVDAITSELQDGIMATRMQPVGMVFAKFRRVVRDLAHQLAKQLEIEIEGEEVELDKTLIEAIGDPLTHLVRNSADHGIESPERRRAAGKKEVGRISLRAFHEAGQVVIEVSDDGAGIDPERVARKALEKRMFTREQLDAMDASEKVRLVFAPGFSTAEKVTDVSGRGVGMDVVLSSLTRVGGTVDIRSEVGRGTTITVRLPLTLAIIPSILVEVNQERFAIPQVNLVELVRIPAGEVQKRIERVGSAQVIRLRGELLPLLRLTDVLGVDHLYEDPSSGEALPDRRAQGFDRRSPALEEAAAPPPAGAERRAGEERRRARSSAVNVVVVAAGNLRYGLVVDQLLDSEEIVVKPLGAHLAGCREYAGATILGDGAVALILDVAGISQAAELAATKALLEVAEARRRDTALTQDAQSYLVVENAPDERFALPLGVVSRIERIQQSDVVDLAGRRTVTHGAEMLALASIEEVARVRPRVAGSRLYAVICRVWGREVGVLASRIVDVVDASSEIDPLTHRQPGILGSTVVEGRVLLLLDVHGLVAQVLPEYRAVKPAAAADPTAPAVLVVEDSPFFRGQIASCLADAGIPTLLAENGEEGLAALQAHADRVAMVLTDVEMPRLDGLEMTRRIRAQARFSDLPIVACTALSGEVAERRGREAGLTEYLIKLDREVIVERSQFHLNRRKGAGAQALSAPSKGAA